MDHTAVPDPPGFEALSRSEQLRYVQALWDRIALEPDEVPVPEIHLKLIEERLAEYRRDPTRAVPAFEAVDRLDGLRDT